MLKNLNRSLAIVGKLAVLALVGPMLALSGCITAENALSQNDVASMRLTAVSVSFTSNAIVVWEDGERAYGGSKGMTDEQMAAARRSQGYRDYVQNTLGPRIRSGVEQALAGQLNGSRPVRLEIVVKQFTLPSVASRVLIGADPRMIASAILVDARSGAAIATNPELSVAVTGARGLIGTAVQAAVDNSRNETQEGQLIARFSQNYRGWLTHGA